MRMIEPYFRFQDERGGITGLLQGMALREVNFIHSQAGTVRGGHYHRSTQEVFCILSGRIEVSLTDLQGRPTGSFTVAAGQVFLVEPGEVHTFRILEDSTWINLLDQPMDPAAPDIHRP
jgi:dTDP-4-dehydrorhamnose 3,5-epimerase-like enzyme